jgi:hypothetical protein
MMMHPEIARLLVGGGDGSDVLGSVQLPRDVVVGAVEADGPLEDRGRSDDEDRPAVTAEHSRQRGEDRSVVGFEARTVDLALQDGELMAPTL